MKILHEDTMYVAISELQEADAAGLTERRMELTGSIYNFLLTKYVTRVKAVLRSYRRSNIAPYDFDEKDGFLDFFHHVFTEKFITGNGFRNFKVDKKDFDNYLITVCENELLNIIARNNRPLPEPEEHSENEGLKYDTVAFSHALLFEGDLTERLTLYCSQQILAIPSEVMQSFIPKYTAGFLLWRSSETKATPCDSGRLHI